MVISHTTPEMCNDRFDEITEQQAREQFPEAFKA